MSTANETAKKPNLDEVLSLETCGYRAITLFTEDG